MSICNSRNKGLEELYENGHSGKIGKIYQKKLLLILDLLNSISDLKDCEGVNGFHELKGERKGTYSMKVSGNYRITFKWDGNNVYDIDFEDYH